jgi:hypothetical protein
MSENSKVYVWFNCKFHRPNERNLVCGPYAAVSVTTDSCCVITGDDAEKPFELAFRSQDGWVVHDGMAETSQPYDSLLVSAEGSRGARYRP